MLEFLIERQRSERQTQIGKFFFQTHHRLHQLTDQNHSIQILWFAEVQRLTCPLWVKSRHLRRKKRCPLYPQDVRCSSGCPLWARSGLMHRSKNYSYSIISSARGRRVGGFKTP